MTSVCLETKNSQQCHWTGAPADIAGVERVERYSFSYTDLFGWRARQTLILELLGTILHDLNQLSGKIVDISTDATRQDSVFLRQEWENIVVKLQDVFVRANLLISYCAAYDYDEANCRVARLLVDEIGTYICECETLFLTPEGLTESGFVKGLLDILNRKTAPALEKLGKTLVRVTTPALS